MVKLGRTKEHAKLRDGSGKQIRSHVRTGAVGKSQSVSYTTNCGE